ncbi:MAG TPA: serine dehydratase subunit alpha family protein, partial [Firmicutes bacterium]|nr:serine dehydratase subunit alpha family protein [Bacillota bacterium]
MQTQLLSVLRAQVKPAFGCTEPVACALAVARAREALGNIDSVDSIQVVCSPGVYKNGLGVGIPGTGERGIPIAAALGALIGRSEQGLEVLSAVTLAVVHQAKELVEQGRVDVTFDPALSGIFVQATVTRGQDSARVIISGSHTNIIYVEKNGQPIYGEPVQETAATAVASAPESISNLSLSDLVDFIETVPAAEIQFLLDGARMNWQAAQEGLTKSAGHGVGKTLKTMLDQGVLGADMATKARIYTAAASDARMGGLPIAIMSSAGSGNHGIEAIIPVTVVWEELKFPAEKLARALALSHLVTVYIKEHTGKISPICGCSVAAGAGSAAACTWLLGGDAAAVGRAIQNIIASLAGVFCDGGKNGCALKLAATAAEAVLAAKLAIRGLSADQLDGIIGKTAEQTIANLGYVSTHGLGQTDAAILTVMQG